MELRNPYLSQAMHRALLILRDLGGEGDVVRKGRIAFVGNFLIKPFTVDNLLSLRLIKESGSNRAGLDRYVMSEDGLAILKSVTYVPRIVRRERCQKRAKTVGK